MLCRSGLYLRFTSQLSLIGIMALTLACGRVAQLSDTKVVGGRAADDHRFMAGISFDGTDKVGCGGAFVAPQIVVTAAHCLQNPDEYPHLKVRPGSGAAGREPMLDVLSIIVHPD
jgi:secreted trypsin-like serine protease